MGQDFQKLQEYRNLKESLAKVWGFVNYNGEIELYDNQDSALAAARDNGHQEDVGIVSVRTAAFWQLHKDVYFAEEDKELEEDEDLDEDDVYFEDEPHPYVSDEDDDLDPDYHDELDGDYPYVAPPPAAPKPTTADIQARLKDLAKFKNAMPQRQPATAPALRDLLETAQAFCQSVPSGQTPVQTAVQSSGIPTNNDGRLTCYACGEPTKIVDTGFSQYCICTACGR